MNLVVLAGGLSPERDISMITGTMVTRALRARGHNVILLDVFMGCEKGGKYMDHPFEHAGILSAPMMEKSGAAPDIEAVRAARADQSDVFFGPNVIELCLAADFVFIALHGQNGEDGRVQAAFDLFGIRYTGCGYLGSALAMDKELTKERFLASGIPSPEGVTIRNSGQLTYSPERATEKKGEKKSTEAAEKEGELESAICSGIPFPCVVKPVCGGSSLGVSIAHNEEEYKKALSEAFRYEDRVIVERYVEGREFSVGVLEYEALPVIEIAPKEGFYDYANKYRAGSSVETCPADLPKDVTRTMQRIAVRVCRALSLDVYARMDFLADRDGRIYCLEANTLPGMTPTSLLPQEAAAAGIGFDKLCEKIIEISMKKYDKENADTA